MPKYPNRAEAARAIRASVFRSPSFELARRAEEFFPFHVGDTWMEPPAGCRMQDLREEDHPGLHRYAPPKGIPSLIAAIAERHGARTRRSIGPGNVLVSAGATGGLASVLGALLSPSDEVLLLAPFWPLIDGIVRAFRGVPVAVPLIGAVNSPESAVEAVAGKRTDRTVALYVSTPNNPSGRVLPRAWLEALVDWAVRHGLWVLADEVYEDFVYDGGHTYAGTLAPERTFSVHSFSKAYGMAGNRCGFVVGPADAMADVESVSTHLVYNATTASQIAALRALEPPGQAWLERARSLYAGLGREAAAILGVDPPQGSTFLFLDVRDRIDHRGLDGVLEECARRGVSVAPGPSFGPYPTHIRVCFTAADPERVRRGMRILAEVLGR